MTSEPKPLVSGTIRIRTKDIKPYIKTSSGWRKYPGQFKELNHVVNLFKSNHHFNNLIDTKNPYFLKGQLGPKKEIQGVRINILPDGTLLDKAFSLFSEQLIIHDEKSNDHWDLMYKNKCGTFSYCYSLDKKRLHRNKKYKAVFDFAKLYPKLVHNVCLALNNPDDDLAIPMYTLLKTKMRIGNEIYFKAHHHKGLSTLKKSDIHIKGNSVTFSYVGKDGVPQDITETFPDVYIKNLNHLLRRIKSPDFVFTSSKGKTLHEKHFKNAFKRYCGKEFYPHIVRSYYATMEIRNFFKKNPHASKEQVKKKIFSIASGLGHKRFVKKEHLWKDNYTVTLNHYVKPQLVQKVRSILSS